MPKPSPKLGQMIATPGKPLQFTETAEAPTLPAFPLGEAIAETIRAYLKAARELLEGKYRDQKDLAPPHMQSRCDVSVLGCTDGVFVRYDLASAAKPVVRWAYTKQSLAQFAPALSDGLIHFPQDPTTYVPKQAGPEMRMFTIDAKGETNNEAVVGSLIIYAKTTLPDSFSIPAPPARPTCLVAVPNEFDFQLGGVLEPSGVPVRAAGEDREHFIIHSRMKLPLGWQNIEIYPPLGEEHWKPEYAPVWAELDLLAAIAQKNLTASTLNSLDSRGVTRERYAALLGELDTLLGGPEEPAHQFLKAHPELLCPTHDRCWSKLPFGKGVGKTVSDFVFREAFNDYLLVEIEAPYRELFRQDGQQRAELTHAINQIADWVQYIADNKKLVEDELGLLGISTSPRMLVVIGRSATMTEENRQKLVTLQTMTPRLRILTYDDLILTARANLERILGPLALRPQNADIYFYRPSSDPVK